MPGGRSGAELSDVGLIDRGLTDTEGQWSQTTRIALVTPRPTPTAGVDAARVNAAVRRAAAAHRSLSADLLRREGVSIGQELLLLELASHQPRTQAELATAAACEPSTITIAVRKLEAAGLVRRTPSSSDGRALAVELTAEGRALVPRLEEIQSQVAGRVTGALPDGTSVADLVALLESITDALGSRDGTREP